jgi:hypothetical protein
MEADSKLTDADDFRRGVLLHHGSISGLGLADCAA